MDYPEFIIPLLAGVFLDSILGDPVWLPHPIRMFGQIIFFGEKKLNTGKYKRLKGCVFSLLLICLVYATLRGVLWLLVPYKVAGIVVSGVFVFYGIANHCLINESLQVIRKLKKEGVEAARCQLSRIVGRDTKSLDEAQIRKAVLETLSENLSDGVIAPLSYFFIGGIPLMFAYKMVNTLDSMIGYKNQRYKEFGWFAARFDDLANLIPARLTALLMVAVSLSFRGLVFIFRYGHKHTSPNAGYPEAALAGILDCRLGGPTAYSGKTTQKPCLGKNNREVTNADVYKACFINVGSMLAMAFLMICIKLFVF